jgi:phosphatidylethanolamine/phosphatidyl-N-methylethanolamine N-methyltransferase
MLRQSYTLLAPIYDLIVANPTKSFRRNNLQHLSDYSGRNVLLTGVGTGLDIPYLPEGPHYFANDLTWAMLKRAKKNVAAAKVQLTLQQTDAMQLPYADKSFDAVVLNLILAVVPDPLRALQETARVIKPGGDIFIFDKFLQPDQTAIIRRTLSLLLRHLATRTDVVFESLLMQCHDLILISNEADMMGGWFRKIHLQKKYH